ncbi:hypothetical protein IT414_00965 [bacterium]|nr:hypothetical protein [bacterium]
MQPQANANQNPAAPVAANADPSATPPKKAKDLRQSTQNHLLLSEIRDGIVVMRDGSLRMVIMASALNFDLKSPQEQDAIESSYQGFLNGLHFPIQILVRSRRMNLDNYLAELERLQGEQENQLLAGLMEDYIYNIRGLIQDINIMDKEFYIVVPYYTLAVTKEGLASKVRKVFEGNREVSQTAETFEAHKRDLIQRTNLVAQGLAQMGVRAAVLNTQELIELFYSVYNEDESQSQSLVEVDELTTPIVERGNAAPMPAGPPPPAPIEPDDMYTAAQREGIGAQATAAPQAADPNAYQQPPQGGQQ